MAEQIESNLMNQRAKALLCCIAEVIFPCRLLIFLYVQRCKFQSVWLSLEKLCVIFNMIFVFDSTYGNNTQNKTVLVSNTMQNVRKNEIEVVFAVFMDIIHTKIKSLHNFLKVAHCTK